MLSHFVSVRHKSHKEWVGTEPYLPLWYAGDELPKPWHGLEQTEHITVGH